MTCILVVEDEPELRLLLKANLEAEGWEIFAAQDGIPALRLHQQHPFDLWILDLMLPEMDGFQVLQALRAQGDEVPVLMLTARGEEAARVQGFESGADDYLVKPFSILELLGRVRAILRRSGRVEPVRARRYRSGPYLIDLDRMGVSRDGVSLAIGARGFRILEVLLRRPGHTLGRSEILNLAWEPDARPGIRTVDVHVGLLRKQLGETAIATIEGVGYRWVHPAEPLREEGGHPAGP